MTSRRRWRHVAVSLLAAGPLGGLLFGLLNAGDPDPNPIGRLVYACTMAVVTPLHAGFPPRLEAGAGGTFNLWPHIAIAFFLIWSGLLFRDWRRSRKLADPLDTPAVK